MIKHNSIWLAAASLFYLGTAGIQAQGAPVTNFFEIRAGQYVACCGIAGPFNHDLPDEQQTYVALIIDHEQLSARMAIFGDDRQTVFRLLHNGRVAGDRIEFGMPIGAPPPFGGLPAIHYIVSNTADGLRFNGAIINPMTGADLPNKFTHTNVVATALAPPPEATIRVSEVEVCWTSVVNQLYQVQYRPSPAGNDWVNLGSPVPGGSGQTCITDNIERGQPRRFYRVLSTP